MPRRDAAADLAEKMLRVLEARRALGGNAYPLTLGQLAELTDPQAAEALIHKATGKSLLKERALVAQKKNLAAPVVLAADLQPFASSPMLLEFALEAVCTPARPTCPPSKLKVDARLKKPLQEAVARHIQAGTLPATVGYRLEKNKPVLYLHRMPPPPLPPPPRKPEVVLAEHLLQVLEAQSRLGEGAYPLTVHRLLELTDLGAAPALRKKALAAKAFQERVLLVDKKDMGSPVALADHRARLTSSALFLEYLLRKRRKATEHAFPVDRLLGKKSELYAPFLEAVSRQIEAGALPPKVGWMWLGKKKQIFFLADIQKGREAAEPPPRELPPTDFAPAFDEAFAGLNRQQGAHNFVNLVDLRRALPVDRATFDAGLRRLRLAGRYTLSAAEGRHGITPEEREAAVTEDGTLLLYVSRKSP